MNSLAQLRSILSEVLCPGDDLVVHSSLRTLGEVPGGADSVLDALLEAVGPSGTLSMMAATRTSFGTTKLFDLLNSPSETGVLTEVMRRRNPKNRSFVPMTSFVSAGKRASEYLLPYNSFLDETSPLQRLIQNNGKILLLGVKFDRCTLFHLAEERHQVPYNFYMLFSGIGIDAASATQPISQRYFVRKDLSLLKKPDLVSLPFVADPSLCFSAKCGGGEVYIFKAADYDNFMTQRLTEDPFCLVRD